MVKILTQTEIEEIKQTSKKIRKQIVKMIHNAKSGHPGGNLSAVDILTVLYKKCMRHYCNCEANPDFSKRDRFILSKGHASAALYAILADCGYFPEEDLLTFRKLGSKLQGHPSCSLLNGIEVSTGSLGQGLSMACGIALGLRLDKIDSKIFVYMGDGELQEGSVWEAVMNAAHYKLNNIIAIVDRNGLQIDGCTESVMSLGSLADKFQSFGWITDEIDGHDIQQIYSSIENAKSNTKPTIIIANTVKGKGISFMENNAGWHGKAPNDEQLLEAIKELR